MKRTSYSHALEWPRTRIFLPNRHEPWYFVFSDFDLFLSPQSDNEMSATRYFSDDDSNGVNETVTYDVTCLPISAEMRDV